MINQKAESFVEDSVEDILCADRAFTKCTHSKALTAVDDGLDSEYQIVIRPYPYNDYDYYGFIRRKSDGRLIRLHNRHGSNVFVSVDKDFITDSLMKELFVHIQEMRYYADQKVIHTAHASQKEEVIDVDPNAFDSSSEGWRREDIAAQQKLMSDAVGSVASILTFNPFTALIQC